MMSLHESAVDIDRLDFAVGPDITCNFEGVFNLNCCFVSFQLMTQLSETNARLSHTSIDDLVWAFIVFPKKIRALLHQD